MWSSTVAHMRYGRHPSEIRVQVSSSGGSGRPYVAATAFRLISSVNRQRIGKAAAAGQDRLRRPRSHAGQCREGRERLGLGQRPQAVRVETPIDRGASQIVESTDLDGADALDVGRFEQPLRTREWTDDPIADLDRVPE